MTDYPINGPPPPPPPEGCFGGIPEWDCFWCEVAAGAISISIAICVAIIYFVPGAFDYCLALLEIYHITRSTYIRRLI